MSVRQYLRRVSVIVGGAPSQIVTSTDQGTSTAFNDPNDGIELSDLRVQFTIRRGDLQTPNSADVRIYNVAEATANRLTSEFTRIAIQAGYEGNVGLLFDGTIKQARTGRMDARDSFVDITAADGDQAYNFSVIAHTLAAGAQPADAVQAFVQSMARQGIKRGYVPALSTNGCQRGRVYYGAVKDELRDFAEANDCLWSIQDGMLTLIPQTAYVPGDVPVISASTGLIGVPERTQNGIFMRVLLNPALKIGQRVKLEATAINSFRFGLDIPSQASNALLESSSKTNADGLYYVMRADHVGDTRGEEWFTELTCLAVDATVPPNLASQGAIAPEAASIRRN